MRKTIVPTESVAKAMEDFFALKCALEHLAKAVGFAELKAWRLVRRDHPEAVGLNTSFDPVHNLIVVDDGVEARNVE